jgi:predicted phosphohydrolase
MPRIVAVADTHGFHERLSVPEGDIFIHAGDLTQRGTLAQLAAVAQWMNALPHRHKIVVAGNHDFAFQNEPQEARALFKNLTYLEDSAVNVLGLSLYGTPWQPWFYDWAYNLHRGAAIAEKWALIPFGLDILITHGPPAGFGDLTRRGERVGCQDLTLALEAKVPRFHLFGHIHEDPGSWQLGGTNVRNITSAECKLAPVVFDVTSRKKT